MTKATLVTSKANKFYYGGLYSSRGYVLVEKNKKVIFCDYRSYTELLGINKEDTIVKLDKNQNPLIIIKQYLEAAGVSELLFEGDDISYSEYLNFSRIFDNIKLIPTNIDAQRRVKSLDEVRKIREACRIVDSVYERVLKYVKVGMTERELSTYISNEMGKLGSQRNAFEPIVVSGIRGALPHGKPTGKRLDYGDFITVDFGAVFEGYCSDITRTFVLGEILDERMLKIFRAVLSTQEAVISTVRPGLICSNVDAYSRELIEEAGFGAYYIHNLGHSIGIECHETPYFTSKDHTKLEKNMVMTVEPGIYVEGLGGVRIEDTVLVGENSCERLTLSKKELTVVEVKND